MAINKKTPQEDFISSRVNKKQRKVVDWISKPLKPAHFNYGVKEVFDLDVKNKYNRSIMLSTRQLEEVSCFLQEGYRLNDNDPRDHSLAIFMSNKGLNKINKFFSSD